MEKIPATVDRSALLAERVSGDYFFLELSGRSRGPLAVAFGGREQCGPGYEVRRRTYPFPTLEYVAAGSGEVRLGGKSRRPLEPGMLFAYGPGQPLHLRTTGPTMTKYFVSLTGGRAMTALTTPVNLSVRPKRLRTHAEIRDIFDLLIREGADHGPRAREICLNLFQRLLLKLEEAELRGPRSLDHAREEFLRYKTMLDADPARFHSLEDVMAAGKVTRHRLFRLFRRYHGGTPYQYLLRQKMNWAARALISSDRLVKDVAESLGFDDPLHFSRVFKQAHGIAPAHLRASSRL